MSAFWLTAAILARIGIAAVALHWSWRMGARSRDGDVMALKARCDQAEANGLDLSMQLGRLHAQVLDLTEELTTARSERDASQAEIASGVRHLADVLADARAALDRGEVAIAQAARWKTERDVLEAEHDVLRAKVERMTGNPQRGRKPKIGAAS